MVDTTGLRSLRNKLELTQDELAAKLGVSRNTVSRWERGSFNPSSENLAALEQLYAQLGKPAEESPGAPDSEFPAEESPAPPKSKRRQVFLVCAGILCALLIGAASLIWLCSMQQQSGPADSEVQMDDLGGEKVDHLPTEAIILHP